MADPALDALDALDRLGLTPADRTVAPVTVDQTNESFVVGGEYVVKLRPEPIADDDVALPTPAPASAGDDATRARALRLAA